MRVRELFPTDAVRSRIAELAQQLARDYADAPFVIVCIDRGAVRFVGALVAALARHRARPEVRHVRARRTEGRELRAVEVESFDPARFEGRDVLVVDDIADEGATLRAVQELVAEAEPRSLRSAVLVDKRESRREPLRLDYVGFEVERGWVVGFGMDLDGSFRELDFVGVVVDPRF
jgi:hypoxanthine phosphoribosyltransferase